MNFFVGIILFVLFFNSSMVLVDGWWNSSYVGYVLYLILLTLLLWYKKLNLNFNKSAILLLVMFVFFSSISALVNNQFVLIVTSLLLLLLYCSLGSFLTSINISIESIVKIAILSQLLIIIIPLITTGINSDPYKGIFNNPNGLGITVTTVLAITLSKFYILLEEYLIYEKENKKVKTKIAYYFVLSAFSFYIVILSESRTSFLTSLAIFVVGFLVLSNTLIREKKLKTIATKIPVISIILIIFLFILNKYFNFIFIFETNIISKFNSVNGNMLNGRNYIWMKTIENTGLWGNGENYFIDTFNIGPHNTFILILGNYGWIPFILFFMFIMLVLFSTIKYSIRKVKDKNRYLPLLSVICFIGLSMGEGMLYSFSMLLMFSVFGVALNNAKVTIKT